MKINNTKNTKILFLSTAKEGNFHNYKFLKSLVESNYDVYLVSYHPSPVADNLKNISGLKIFHYPPFLLKKSLFFNRVFHFRKLLRKIKPDVVHSGNVNNVSFLASLSGFHPLLVMPMGSDILIYPKKHKIIKFINRFVFSRADWVTCDAEYVKNTIVNDYSFNSEKITVFPWGIELNVFSPNSDNSGLRNQLGWDDKVVILQNRHFEPVYDHNTLIESFRIAVDKNPNIRLLLVGDGPLKEDIASKLNEYNLSHYVHLTGRVNRDQMVGLINLSDIYISTSISDGTSVSLLEALACRKPVILSDIPCNREWVKDGINGLLSNVGNVKEFSDNMVKLANNPDLREKMAEINLGLATSKANWKKNFSKLEDIYKVLTK